MDIYRIIFLLALVVLITLMTLIINKTEGFSNFLTRVNGRNINKVGKEQMSVYDGIEDGALTPQTINYRTKIELQKILGGILNQINYKTKSKYYLRKIDRVNMEKIKQGLVGDDYNLPGIKREFLNEGEFLLGVRYTIDFFAHELKNQHTRRFVVIFTVDNDYNVKVEHFNLSNAWFFENKVFDDDVDVPELLTNETLLGNDKYHIMGINNSKLEFSKFNPEGLEELKRHKNADPYELGANFIPGLTHDTIPEENMNTRKTSTSWDKYGVFFIDDNNNEQYNGQGMLDHAYDVRPTQPFDNPTINESVTDRDELQNGYLFDMRHGNISNTL